MRVFSKMGFGMLFLCAGFLIAFTSCEKDEFQPDENLAFTPKSGGCTVWTNETVSTGDIDFDYVAKVYGNVVGITEEEDDCGKFYQLGFIVTENSQNPGLVYAQVNPTNGTWRRLNECRGSTIAGFWDGLSKNDSKDALIVQQGTDKNFVYLFYGNAARKVQRFRVDNGEVLKANGHGFNLPGGFKGGTMFFHDSNRADFPANWLGVKGKKLWSFGPKLTNTPALIPLRQNGFGGADLNKEIRRVKGYWPHNKQRIVIERTGNRRDITVQKERNSGINFYKGR